VSLVIVERRKQARHRASQHRLARPRRTAKEQMVATGCRDFKCCPSRRLTSHIGKVGNVRCFGRDRFHGVTRMQATGNLHGVGQGADRLNAEVLTARRLRHRLQGEKARLAKVSSHESSSEATPSRTHATVEGEFTQSNDVGRPGWQFPVCGQYAERDRQVVCRTDLRKVGRRKVHHDPLRWEGIRCRRDRGSDAFRGFAHRGIREPDDDKARLASTDVRLNTDRVRVDADDGT
jgi:hypothetical protein